MQPKRSYQRHKKQNGFSLVELSIVITIIALIIGGILGGRALQHQARISQLMSQVTEIKTAHIRFQEKYGQIPGDFDNAERFWKQCIDATDNPCNGNGDGYISYPDNESLRAWQHLTLSGLYPGSYTGLRGSGLKLDDNIPSSAFPRTGFDVNFHNSGGFAPVFGRYGNSIQISSEDGFPDWGGVTFTPIESYNIDKKFDDGVPSAGDIRVSTWGAGTNPLCTTQRANQSSAEYVLGNDGRTCRMWVFGIN